MSTRSTYRFRQTYEYEGKRYTKNLALVYVQMDGYPSGHPVETAEWLAGGKVVNGISLAEKAKVVFNGAGCLAAQFIAENKNGAGGLYMQEMKSRGNCGEDYLYDVIVDEDTKAITFAAYEAGWGKVRTKKLYSGTPKGFVKWVKDVYNKQR